MNYECETQAERVERPERALTFLRDSLDLFGQLSVETEKVENNVMVQGRSANLNVTPFREALSQAAGRL